MAGPVAASITLPSDTGNAGKVVKTQTKASQHEHFFVPDRQAVVLGVYAANLPLQAVVASAQNGTSTGFAWLHVPTAITGKKVRIREIEAEFGLSTITAMISNPRLAITRFTFTGTASGASVTPEKLASAYPTQVLDIRTAVTGLTVTMGGILGATLVPPGLLAGTAASFAQGVTMPQWLWGPPAPDMEDDFIVLAPGEGICIWQPDAGTTSDTRKFIGNIYWDEIDVS